MMSIDIDIRLAAAIGALAGLVRNPSPRGAAEGAVAGVAASGLLYLLPRTIEGLSREPVEGARPLTAVPTATRRDIGPRVGLQARTASATLDTDLSAPIYSAIRG